VVVVWKEREERKKDELTARQDTHINNHHISMPRKALAQGGSMQVDSLPYSKE
jgi:hypothetical protein